MQLRPITPSVGLQGSPFRWWCYPRMNLCLPEFSRYLFLSGVSHGIFRKMSGFHPDWWCAWFCKSLPPPPGWHWRYVQWNEVRVYALLRALWRVDPTSFVLSNTRPNWEWFGIARRADHFFGMNRQESIGIVIMECLNERFPNLNIDFVRIILWKRLCVKESKGPW